MLILLIGASGSGKSEAERILSNILGQKCDAFANPLKQIALTLGFEHHEVYGTQAQRLVPNRIWGVSGRVFCQRFGTEICRDALPKIIPEMKNLWIRLMDEKIKANRNIIISDGRFEDEIDLVRKHKGIIIKIERASVNKINKMNEINKMLHDEVKSHSSETQELQFDYLIDNDGTIADLRNQLTNFITFLKHSGTIDAEGRNLSARFVEKRPIELSPGMALILENYKDG